MEERLQIIIQRGKLKSLLPKQGAEELLHLIYNHYLQKN